MTTPSERANQLRGNLNERAGGIRGRLNARAQRLAEGLARNLSEIIERPPTPPTLRREEPRGGIPSARGYAQSNYQPGSSTGGGGIAGPLVEGATTPEGGAATDPVLDRTYHPVSVISSTDGLFSFEYQALAEITMRDANGSEVVIILADPEA
jgi:hypothetical protein